jgi:tetratricopeptide (TPR) repeat protein
MNSVLLCAIKLLFSARNGDAAKMRCFARKIPTLALAVLWICMDQGSPAQATTNLISTGVTNGSNSAVPLPQSSSPVNPSNAGYDAPLSLLSPEDSDAQKRFEIYLSGPETSKDKVDGYLYNVSFVLSLLANNNPSGARNILPELIRCPQIDAGITDELAAKIDAIGEVQRLKNKIEKTNNDLQKSIDTPERSPDEIADAIRKQSQEQGKGQETAPSANDQGASDVLPPPAGIPATPQLTQEYVRSVQTEAKIQANEQDKKALLSQAKAEFGMYVSHLYTAHHYYHVLMAAGFYRQLFNESNYPADMATQVKEASDLNNEVAIAMKAFRGEANQGHIAAAAGQLQQAFLLSDADPEIMGVPSAQRTAIKMFKHELLVLRNLLEARNFADLDSVLHSISQTAPDFDATPTKKFVDTIKNNGEDLLKKGKLLLRQGDPQNAIKAFQEAEEVWPSNPDLLGGALPLLKSEENRNQLVITFDRLLAERDFPGVYIQRSEFANALTDDSSRSNQLEAAVKKVDAERSALEKAKALQATGDVNGAWETIEVAVANWPENVELIKMRGTLSDGAAEFARAIGRAQYAESQNELGYSLSWYAVAQHNYPVSALARDGIARLTKQILGRA